MAWASTLARGSAAADLRRHGQVPLIVGSSHPSPRARVLAHATQSRPHPSVCDAVMLLHDSHGGLHEASPAPDRLAAWAAVSRSPARCGIPIITHRAGHAAHFSGGFIGARRNAVSPETASHYDHRNLPGRLSGVATANANLSRPAIRVTEIRENGRREPQRIPGFFCSDAVCLGGTGTRTCSSGSDSTGASREPHLSNACNRKCGNAMCVRIDHAAKGY